VRDFRISAAILSLWLMGAIWLLWLFAGAASEAGPEDAPVVTDITPRY